MIYKIKERITTNLHDPYKLGYFMCYNDNCTKSCNNVNWS